MVATLTVQERQIGMALSVALAILGLAMAAVAKTGPMALHGGMALVLGIALVFHLGGALYDHPEPPVQRLAE